MARSLRHFDCVYVCEPDLGFVAGLRGFAHRDDGCGVDLDDGSAAHAWISGFPGFAAARRLLGLGEGATFPGGLRAADRPTVPAKQL
jgi:hypothetical protein